MLIFKKVLRGGDAKITNVNTNTSTLIGEFCEKTVSPCDNNIEFSLDETGLEIIDVNWELVPPIYDNVVFANNNKSISDVIDADKKYLVEVLYSDGSKAKDSVFAIYINLEVKLPDTLYLCQNSNTKIEGELFVNGKLETNNSKILWNWRPFGLFNKIEDNIAYRIPNIPDTTISCDVVYQVSDSVTKCVLSKQVVLINKEHIFKLAIDSVPCSNEKTIRIEGANGEPIDLSETKNIWWGLNNELIDPKYHISMDSVKIEDTGLLVVTLETTGGCLFNFSQTINNSSNNGNQKILPDIDTDYCINDTITLSPIRDFDYYLWNSYFETKDLIVRESGVYFLFAVDSTTGCEFIDTIIINFHDYPKYNIEDYNVLICNGEAKQINLNTDDNNSVVWYDELGKVLSEEQILSVSKPSKIFTQK